MPLGKHQHKSGRWGDGDRQPSTHTELEHVYEQVPPDYWDRSVYSNPIQRLYHSSRYAAVAKFLESIPRGGHLLDVGCGSGFSIAEVVADRSDITVDGVDVSPELIAYARKQRPQFNFQVSPGETLPFPDATFDVVTYLDTIEHLIEPPASLRETMRVLRPGGIVIVQVVFEHHPLFQIIWKLWMATRGKVWEHAHLRVYDCASLRKAVADAGFHIEAVRVMHAGMSGIVVGKKSV